jgi:hypothetical protein
MFHVLMLHEIGGEVDSADVVAVDEGGTLKGAIGTLNQGYPLLQYEGATPVRRLLVTRRVAPDPTTWAGLRAPRGEEG